MAQSTSSATGSPLGTHASSDYEVVTTPSTIHDTGGSTQRAFNHTENPDTQRLSGQRIDSPIRNVSPESPDTDSIALQNHGSRSDYHHSHTNNSGDSPVATHLSTNPRHNHSKDGPTYLEAYIILPVRERSHEPPAWTLKIQLLPLNVKEIITHLRVLGTDYSVIQSLLRDLPSEYIDLITIRVKARNGQLRSVHRIRKRDIVTATGSFKPESAIFVLETSEVAEEEKPIKHASGAAAAKATSGQLGSAVGSFGGSQTSDSLSTTLAFNEEYSSNNPFAEPMTSGTGHVTSTRSGNEVSRETWNPTSSSSQLRPSVYGPSAFGSQRPYFANRWTVDNPLSGSQTFDSQPGASPLGASAIEPEPYFPNECDDFFQKCNERQSRSRQLIQPSIDKGNACQYFELEDTSVGSIQPYPSIDCNPEYRQYFLECQSQHTSMCSPNLAPNGWTSASLEELPDFRTVMSDTGNQSPSAIDLGRFRQTNTKDHDFENGRLVTDKPSTPSTSKNPIEPAVLLGSQTPTPQHVGSWSHVGACTPTASSPTASTSTSRPGGYAFPGSGGNSSATPAMPSPRGGNGLSKFQFDSLAGTRLGYALGVSPFGSPRRTPKDVPPFGSGFDSLAQDYDYPMMNDYLPDSWMTTLGDSDADVRG
jgi:hypothetical protein